MSSRDLGSSISGVTIMMKPFRARENMHSPEPSIRASVNQFASSETKKKTGSDENQQPLMPFDAYEQSAEEKFNRATVMTLDELITRTDAPLYVD
jgi:uncharacterized YccA/Bax inhibitor family protein